MAADFLCVETSMLPCDMSGITMMQTDTPTLFMLLNGGGDGQL